jgi:hypothetical protein
MLIRSGGLFRWEVALDEEDMGVGCLAFILLYSTPIILRFANKNSFNIISFFCHPGYPQTVFAFFLRRMNQILQPFTDGDKLRLGKLRW